MCCNTGKTSRARALARYYNTPVLVIDDVVTEALYYSGSPAAVTARMLCTEAALRAADPSSANDSNTDKTTPVQRPPRMLLATMISTELAFRCLADSVRIWNSLHMLGRSYDIVI